MRMFHAISKLLAAAKEMFPVMGLMVNQPWKPESFESSAEQGSVQSDGRVLARNLAATAMTGPAQSYQSKKSDRNPMRWRERLREERLWREMSVS